MFRKLFVPILVLLATPAQADRVGIPTPSVWTTCSPNGVYCARLDPVSNSISVYAAGASADTLWTMTGWSGVAALADDGVHLVLGYEGMSLIPLDFNTNMPMLTFYRRGAVLRVVRLRDLVRQRDLQRTVSHYYWGDYLGPDGEGHYVVRVSRGGEIRFSMTTGERVP